jgi:hypothetical protein
MDPTLARLSLASNRPVKLTCDDLVMAFFYSDERYGKLAAIACACVQLAASNPEDINQAAIAWLACMCDNKAAMGLERKGELVKCSLASGGLRVITKYAADGKIECTWQGEIRGAKFADISTEIDSRRWNRLQGTLNVVFPVPGDANSGPSHPIERLIDEVLVCVREGLDVTDPFTSLCNLPVDGVVDETHALIATMEVATKAVILDGITRNDYTLAEAVHLLNDEGRATRGDQAGGLLLSLYTQNTKEGSAYVPTVQRFVFSAMEGVTRTTEHTSDHFLPAAFVSEIETTWGDVAFTREPGERGALSCKTRAMWGLNMTVMYAIFERLCVLSAQPPNTRGPTMKYELEVQQFLTTVLLGTGDLSSLYAIMFIRMLTWLCIETEFSEPPPFVESEKFDLAPVGVAIRECIKERPGGAIHIVSGTTEVCVGGVTIRIPEVNYGKGVNCIFNSVNTLNAATVFAAINRKISPLERGDMTGHIAPHTGAYLVDLTRESDPSMDTSLYSLGYDTTSKSYSITNGTRTAQADESVAKQTVWSNNISIGLCRGINMPKTDCTYYVSLCIYRLARWFYSRNKKNASDVQEAEKKLTSVKYIHLVDPKKLVRMLFLTCLVTRAPPSRNAAYTDGMAKSLHGIIGHFQNNVLINKDSTYQIRLGWKKWIADGSKAKGAPYTENVVFSSDEVAVAKKAVSTFVTGVVKPKK